MYVKYCERESMQVSHERVREILAPLTSGPGLEFKLPTDTDFIHKSVRCGSGCVCVMVMV